MYSLHSPRHCYFLLPLSISPVAPFSVGGCCCRLLCPLAELGLSNFVSLPSCSSSWSSPFSSPPPPSPMWFCVGSCVASSPSESGWGLLREGCSNGRGGRKGGRDEGGRGDTCTYITGLLRHIGTGLNTVVVYTSTVYLTIYAAHVSKYYALLHSLVCHMYP